MTNDELEWKKMIQYTTEHHFNRAQFRAVVDLIEDLRQAIEAQLPDDATSEQRFALHTKR